MSQLIESIRLLNGVFSNLNYHQARMNDAIDKIFHRQNANDLRDHLKILQYPKEGLFKCRIVYDTSIYQTEFIPYVPKSISRLKVVEADIDYAFKYKNRTAFDELLAHRNACDDIIIVKNGLVTDSSYSNLLFFDGTNWITPSKPLLKGTMRQQLLDAGTIKAGMIHVDDLKHFHQCRLINAMVGFDGQELSVSQIVF